MKQLKAWMTFENGKPVLCKGVKKLMRDARIGKMPTLGKMEYSKVKRVTIRWSE